MGETPGKPMPFYYQLELCLTADRVWVELASRHPIYGRMVWDSWGMLRPSGACTEQYVTHLMWTAALEASTRADDRS